MISNRTALHMLLLQAASGGRGELLFGESLDRVKKFLPDFVDLGDLSAFPDVYLEFPLMGKPFLDATVLYRHLPENAQLASPLAAGTQQMLSWLAMAESRYPDICGGFEIDTKFPSPGPAAIHFQPREHTELAGEFCEITGQPQYGQLYERTAARMPENQKLSFFGMFRGRVGSPLRVCGYMNREEAASCAGDPPRLIRLFSAVGFTAYDERMLREICSVLAVSPGSVDFQFDIWPNGTAGDSFAIDTSFPIEQPETVLAAFYDREGSGAKYIDLLQKWKIADERWKKGLEAVFAGAFPLRDGTVTFSLFPHWFKVRWTGKRLQPAKMYLLAKAGILSD